MLSTRVAVALGAVIFALGLIIGANAIGTRSGPTGPGAGSGAAGTSRSAISRAEFSAAVVGKTQAEILNTVGRPTMTNTGVGGDTWSYEGLVYDPITGKGDYYASIWFRGDVAERVSY